jgi:type VI secretion system protein ImpM
MNIGTAHNEFGYFGKLPTRGDFIHQILPQDFTNGFHEWLQFSMSRARDALGDEFLTYYLNCPSWKFIMSPGVCGVQSVAGVTIPSVDKVGRYFNFTLATVLPAESNPISYVISNRAGFKSMELLALDFLESDYSNHEVEMKVREASLQFNPREEFVDTIETNSDFLRVSIDRPLPFADQASSLLSHLVNEKLSEFSVWWYGQEGQTMSNMVVCQGMPTEEVYLQLLTMESPPASPESEAEEKDYIDKIISGEV